MWLKPSQTQNSQLSRLCFHKNRCKWKKVQKSTFVASFYFKIPSPSIPSLFFSLPPSSFSLSVTHKHTQSKLIIDTVKIASHLNSMPTLFFSVFFFLTKALKTPAFGECSVGTPIRCKEKRKVSHSLTSIYHTLAMSQTCSRQEILTYNNAECWKNRIVTGSTHRVSQAGKNPRQRRRGLPLWLSGKESACSADSGSIPGLGRFSGGGMATHPSVLENTGESHGQRSLVGHSPSGTKSWTRLKRLSMHTHIGKKKGK